MKTRNRIFKLRSGEDVIANLKGKSGERYILDRPMAMKVTTVHNSIGFPQEQLFMRNWLSTSTTNEIKIPEDWVILISTPTEDVDKEYQKNLALEDVEPPKENTAGLPESYLKMLEEIQQEEKKLLSDINQPKNKSILINMALPPEVFMEMLKNGFLGEELGGFEEDDDDDDDWFFDSNRFNDDHEGF